jgi:hypothetical protein
MKKLLIAIAITASLTYGYCQYITKTGEYTPSGYANYKICEYGSWTIRLDRYGMCPMMISVDTYTGTRCD